MSNKVASVGLVLQPQGFIQGLRAAERAGLGTFQRLAYGAGQISRRLKNAVDGVTEIAKAAGKIARDPLGGFVAGFRRIVDASKDAARKMRDAFNAGFSGVIFPGEGSGGGAGRGRGGAKGSAGALGAGALIVYDVIKKLATVAIDTTREVNATHEKAVQLSVNAKKGGGSYIAPGVLEAQAYATAADVKGTTADQALEAMSAFVTLTGDIKTAQSSITTFAQASKASGADMKDVAEAAASISKQFGIVDPGQIKDVLAALIYQGKEGAIMLPEQAKGLQKIAAAGAAFGISKDVSGVQKLGGLVQMARGGTGSAEQAFTAVEAVFRGLTEKGKELQAQHVKVYEGTGAKKHTRSIDDILIDVVSKAGGKDIGKKNAALSEIFGGEGIRAISPFVGTYQTAFQNAEGTDKEKTAAGVAALREQLGGLVHAAGEWTDVLEDSEKMQRTVSAKSTAAWEEFKGKLSAGVIPALGKLADKLGEGDMGIDTLVNVIEMITVGLGGLADALKFLGFIKEKSNFDKAKAAQAQRERYEEEAGGLMADADEYKKSDPKGYEKRMKKAHDLQEKAAQAGKEEFDLVSKSFQEGTPDQILRQAFPETYGKPGQTMEQARAEGLKGLPVAGGEKLPPGFREQFLAKQADVGFFGRPGQAVAQAGQGGPSTVKIDAPVKIDASRPIPIRIVADDSKRGSGAAPPPPGPAPR